MLVNLYVNWKKGIILNEKQAQETIENEYYNNATNHSNFSEWLSENYSLISLFYMGEDEKEGVRADFMEEMKGVAWDVFAADGYEEVSVEI
jgi:hypothetical protein